MPEPLPILFQPLLRPECSCPGIPVDIPCAAADLPSPAETQLCLHQASVVQKSLENPLCIRLKKKTNNNNKKKARGRAGSWSNS